MNIDHTQDTWVKITGLTEQDINDLSKKIADTISELHNEDRAFISHFLEQLQEKYSYDELLILASQAIEMHYKKSVLYQIGRKD